MIKVFATITFLILFSISAFAQGATIKMAFMNTDAFYDEKVGITKLITANTQLNNEFGSRLKELQDGNTKLQGISNELQNMQKLPTAQFNAAAFNTKKDEGERLQRELNFKKTELETAITKRRNELMAPITQDVGKAMIEYANKNGYTIIFDVAKLDDVGAILHLAQPADVTKDFITFYNARSATPAAASPKTPAKPPVKP